MEGVCRHSGVTAIDLQDIDALVQETNYVPGLPGQNAGRLHIEEDDGTGLSAQRSGVPGGPEKLCTS